MADGTFKAIEDVQPGDKVTTYNTDTGEQEAHTVTVLFRKTAEILLEITVDTTTSNGADDQTATGDPEAKTTSGTDPPEPTDEANFTVTPEHPFWQADTSTWTLAGDLQPGDQLLQRDGDHITITAIAALERDQPFTVYNFTVDGTHNYYATTVDTLVHNCSAPDPATRDDMANSGFRPGRNGKAETTHAGLEYGKHQLMPGQPHPKRFLPRVGDPKAILDRAGQALLDDILFHPQGVEEIVTGGNFPGGRRVIRPDGVGAVFDINNVFQYFGKFTYSGCGC